MSRRSLSIPRPFMSRMRPANRGDPLGELSGISNRNFLIEAERQYKFLGAALLVDSFSFRDRPLEPFSVSARSRV